MRPARRETALKKLTFYYYFFYSIGLSFSQPSRDLTSKETDCSLRATPTGQQCIPRETRLVRYLKWIAADRRLNAVSDKADLLPALATSCLMIERIGKPSDKPMGSEQGVELNCLHVN